MKQIVLSLLLLSCLSGAAAQNSSVALEGVFFGPEGPVVSEPHSVLAVDVAVRCERIIAGPYARYAQKFLGVRAPLTDKTVWSVQGASVALLDETACFAAPEAPAASGSSVASHAVSDEDFARILPDKTSMAVPALEDAAREAVNTIFSLRRHRLELITGEAGENVFGAGLQAALDEIARLEQSYLELFLGKRVLTNQTRRYVIYPRSDKRQYIVCRFSTADGLLPENDLSGDMLLLQIEPSEAAVSVLEAGPKVKEVVMCRVADPSTCTVIAAGREYARTVLPLFEFGRTIRVAAPAGR